MRRSRSGEQADGAITRAVLETLEGRQLLSAQPALSATVAKLNALLTSRVFSQKQTARNAKAHVNVIVQTPTSTKASKGKSAKPNSTTPPGSALTPAQVRAAYGLDQVTFGGITGDGTGQTIAIIDAYDYPTALADLQHFDQQFGLPDPPSFKRVAQDGSTNYPTTDPGGSGRATWEEEEALDIEWAHVVAPKANIMLVEASDDGYTNLVQNAAAWAAKQPGVVAVSMSFGGAEFSGEDQFDAALTTPAGHAGVTFLASTGDAGQPGGYPAYSPNVVSVGGTTLSLNAGAYGSESAWSGSGGGISTQEGQPAYQNGVVTQSSTQRTTPDVAWLADPSTGVAIYDSYDFGSSGGWIQIGGTSLATPMWAGLVAIADQGRSIAGLSSLDGRSQTLPALYSLPATDFHDVTTGNNGFGAGVGYDLVTGRGTPIANKLIPDLAGVGTVSGTVYEDRNANGTQDAGEPGLSGVTVYVDANNNGIYDAGGTASAPAPAAALPVAIPDSTAAGATTAANVALSGTISHVSVTLSVTHARDSDLTLTLIGPDGTSVTLANQTGGVNYSATTFDDAATQSLTSGGSHAGTFKPASPLSVFNGKSAAGTWTLKVVDKKSGTIGTITNFSLTVTTAAELAATTDANGNYAFPAVPFAAGIKVRQVSPAGYVQTTPTASGDGVQPAANTVSLSYGQSATAVQFSDFPTVFSTSADGDAYTVTLDATGKTVQISHAASALPSPTYQIALSVLPSLTFNLQGTNETVYVDATNGSPAPTGGLTITGTLGNGDGAQIASAGTQGSVTLTDDPPTTANALYVQNLSSLSIYNCAVDFNGTFDTIDNVLIASGTLFRWLGS